MTRKALLIISSPFTSSNVDIIAALKEWDIKHVSSLVDASRELRASAYTVGLLVYEREHHQADIDPFLRRHSGLQWLGVFSPRDLESNFCRDLIVEHFYDFHTRPVDTVRLAHTLGHAHGWAMLRQRCQGLVVGADGESPLIGACDVMQRLRSQIERVARVTAPVLIWGESGSGKELTARAIHDQSDRARFPFVPVNCGAMSPTLIHSELFGYERGAFTGANRAKVGLIESADGGTLFLDEIGDLSKDLQVNLLRFLQEGTICRLGSTRSIRVDVRVVAASHVQLQEAVSRGDFREDLYYRLAVLPVTVPPLRERREDLGTLATHFFGVYAAEKSCRLKGFSDSAINAIFAHDWPGNVRELINRVRRAMVMADGRLITPDDLGLTTDTPTFTPAALDDARMHSERSALRECLERSGQNVSRAARHLGVSRTTMYRLLDKHGMRASPGPH